jgi:hypothetical protein
MPSLVPSSLYFYTEHSVQNSKSAFLFNTSSVPNDDVFDVTFRLCKFIAQQFGSFVSVLLLTVDGHKLI